MKYIATIKVGRLGRIKILGPYRWGWQAELWGALYCIFEFRETELEVSNDC